MALKFQFLFLKCWSFKRNVLRRRRKYKYHGKWAGSNGTKSNNFKQLNFIEKKRMKTYK